MYILFKSSETERQPIEYTISDTAKFQVDNEMKQATEQIKQIQGERIPGPAI